MNRNLLWIGLAVSLGCSTAALAQASLRVGAARVDITPAADPANPPSGKYAHERLYVRAIVLDNGSARAALIGADQAGLSEEIWSAASKQIAAELDCRVENIVMSATHTHSGWGNGQVPRPGAGPGAEAANQPPPLVAQIVDAVRQAKTKLQPALVGFGTGFSYLNVNRDAIDPETRRWTQAPNLNGPSDKTVAVIKFSSPNGAPISVYMDYAMHSGKRISCRLHQRRLCGRGFAVCGAGLRGQGRRGFCAGSLGGSEPLVSKSGDQCDGIA